MIHTFGQLPLFSYLLLTIWISILGGCAPKGPDANVPESREQAYINLKLGFSVVVPIEWQRKKYPVSSTNYRPGRVTWNMVAQKGPGGTLSVEVIQNAKESSPTDILCAFLDERKELVQSKLSPVLFPQAEALRLDGKNQENWVIYQVIKKAERAFIIAIEISPEPAEKGSYLETIIKSFKIL